MRTEDCYQLGTITKPHGLRGEVNVMIDADNPEAYDNLESVFVEINQKLVPFFMESFSLRGNRALAAFEGVETIEQAEDLRGATLYLPLNLLPGLEGHQFYYHEVIGYTIYDEAEGALGTIKNIYESGRQDIIEMQYQDKEVLIPISDEIVIGADHEQQQLQVRLPEGLLSVYLDA